MLRTNYRCVQSLNISVDVAKFVENYHKFTQNTHFSSVTNLTGNLFIMMSSYVNNKLQMCSDTQHQCRRRQMCGKLSQIHTVHSLFVSYKKLLVLTEQSILHQGRHVRKLSQIHTVHSLFDVLLCK